LVFAHPACQLARACLQKLNEPVNPNQLPLLQLLLAYLAHV
jgi:hypothetical protein